MEPKQLSPINNMTVLLINHALVRTYQNLQLKCITWMLQLQKYRGRRKIERCFGSFQTGTVPKWGTARKTTQYVVFRFYLNRWRRSSWTHCVNSTFSKLSFSKGRRARSFESKETKVTHRSLRERVGEVWNQRQIDDRRTNVSLVLVRRSLIAERLRLSKLGWLWIQIVWPLNSVLLLRRTAYSCDVAHKLTWKHSLALASAKVDFTRFDRWFSIPLPGI